MPFLAVVRSESVRNIIRERRMLEHVNHPFICNLRYSFQDIEYMCVPSLPWDHPLEDSLKMAGAHLILTGTLWST